MPINATSMAVVKEARTGAITDYVVEWAGQPVHNLETGIATSADKACLDGIPAHFFRYTAAVWMIEAGIPMEKMSQFLGHKNSATSVRMYTRYPPSHLRKAAEAL